MTQMEAGSLHLWASSSSTPAHVAAYIFGTWTEHQSSPLKIHSKRKICTSCPVASIHISWGECANLMWFVGREDTIWLLDLDGYDLFNQIPKAFEYNGWVFFHVCPICYWKETPVLWQKRHMAICTARTMEFFFRQKGYKIKTGSLPGT